MILCEALRKRLRQERLIVGKERVWRCHRHLRAGRCLQRRNLPLNHNSACRWKCSVDLERKIHDMCSPREKEDMGLRSEKDHKRPRPRFNDIGGFICCSLRVCCWLGSLGEEAFWVLIALLLSNSLRGTLEREPCE